MDLIKVAKDLGVFLDENLTLNYQLNSVVKSCNHQLKNIYFIRKFLTTQCLKMLVINQVISRLDFCNSIYANLPKFQIRKLQIILNKAARLITSTPYDQSITPHLIDLHWLPLKVRICFKICTITKLALLSNRTAYLCKELNATRNRLFVPRINTNFGKRAFSFCAPMFYNSLPIELKSLNNVRQFKKKLKSHLFSKSYDLNTKTINEDYKV